MTTNDRRGRRRAVALALIASVFLSPVPVGPAWAGEGAASGGDGHGSNDPSHREWGYEGATGPDHWAEISQNYAVCAQGQQESPVDLRGAVPARLGPLAIDWRRMPLRVTNNGHTIQVEAPPSTGSTLRLAGRTYVLEQFHVHHPSEHLLGGRRFPLELHFVHRGPDGVLSVLGVFVAPGAANPTLQAVLDATPTTKGATRTVAGASLDPSGLLPARSRHGYLRYEGSLTTPPCTENVDWVVLSEPIHASAAQIAAFAELYPSNARPLQALNRRFLLRDP